MCTIFGVNKEHILVNQHVCILSLGISLPDSGHGTFVYRSKYIVLILIINVFYYAHFVFCVCRNITEQYLDMLFGKYGQIVQKNLLKDKLTGMPRGVAFVRSVLF